LSPDTDGILQRLTIARREIGSLKSEKTILLALAIQLFIAGFSSFLVVGLVSMYDPGSVDGANLEVVVTGNASDEMTSAIDQVDGLDSVEYDSRSRAFDSFRNPAADGRPHAVIVATHTERGRISVTSTLPDESIQTTLLTVQLQDALRTLERQERDRNADRLPFTPLELPPEGESNPYYGFTYTVLVPLLLFLPVFISGSIAVDSISEEIERGTLELLRVSPVSLTGIVDAKLLATASLAPIQAGLWLALLEFNGTSIDNFTPLLLLVTALSAVVVAFGMVIALLTPDRRQAQLVYSMSLLALFAAAVALPEHPANTVAKLAIGSPSSITWIATALIVVLGGVLFAAAREGIRRLDPESIDAR
jgi:ABC-type Na+ efflux pump permease subunit